MEQQTGDRFWEQIICFSSLEDAQMRQLILRVPWAMTPKPSSKPLPACPPLALHQSLLPLTFQSLGSSQVLNLEQIQAAKGKSQQGGSKQPVKTKERGSGKLLAHPGEQDQSPWQQQDALALQDMDPSSTPQESERKLGLGDP